MTQKRLELCHPCALKLISGGVRIKKTESRADNKITCAECGRRRYGAVYERERRDES